MTTRFTALAQRGLGRLAVAAGVVPLVLLGLSSPASADSGGGCSGYSSYGWSYDVCISTGGGKVHADAFRKSAGSTGSSCTVYIAIYELWAGTRHPVAGGEYSCSSGYVGKVSAVKRSGSAYETSMLVRVDGGAPFLHSSPVQYT
ncbi:hypothetical protein ACIQWR_38565 [Streptomyces sp. NPDC098789]|uniref:hypothetical protein n=1 Tax=Streptomyces sp. NPDC098789 TaxID=3366098 RepID=UPI00380980A8